MTDQETPSELAPPTEANKTKNKSKSSWIVNSLILCVFGFILLAMFATQLKCYGCGTRAYDSDTKANLHNVYLACKAFWADSGAGRVCGMDIATSVTYGYIQSRNVKVIVFGNEKTFVGLGYNIKNNKAWKIDAKGTIE